MATTPTGSNIPTNVGQQTSTTGGLAEWAGPGITSMLGKVEAQAATPYQAYTGELTAGPSALQKTAFSGIGGLTIPTDQMTAYTPQSFTAADAQSYMNPFLSAALQPQLDEARRQAQIERIAQTSRMSRSPYSTLGGGRQAIMESELSRNLGTLLNKITGEGYKTAFDKAQEQFNVEQQRQMAATKQAQDYGLSALQKQADLGGIQRGIEQEGLTADIKQFEQERDYPYKQLEWQRQFYKDLPITASNYGYSQPDFLSNLFGTGSGLMTLLRDLGVLGSTTTNAGSSSGSSGSTGTSSGSGSSGTTKP